MTDGVGVAIAAVGAADVVAEVGGATTSAVGGADSDAMGDDDAVDA